MPLEQHGPFSHCHEYHYCMSLPGLLSSGAMAYNLKIVRTELHEISDIQAENVHSAYYH